LTLAAAFVFPLMLVVLFMPRAEPMPGQSKAVEVVGGVILGIFFLMLAGSFYLVATLTRCLTFDFRAPVWRKFRWRFVIANLIFQTFVFMAFAFFLSSVASVALAVAGRSGPSSLIGIGLAVLVVFPLLHAVNVWVPLERSLTARILAARGVSPDEIARATPVGLSDPALRSWKKGLIEDDIGALWLGTSALIYRGDAESLYIPREQIIAIERDVDPSNTATVAGAAHPVVVWTSDAGVKRWRVHVEGQWLTFGVAGRLDLLADRIEKWRSGAPTTAGSA
jgi:hypothetical protein